jgi:hypothetical protein
MTKLLRNNFQKFGDTILSLSLYILRLIVDRQDGRSEILLSSSPNPPLYSKHKQKEKEEK